jgi:carbon-monoxide dehydrogenase medium subunit
LHKDAAVKPPEVDYVAPETLEVALDALADDPEARILAGGQSLMPLLNFRLAHPSLLVDLARVAGLDSIRQENGDLVLGAMVRQADAEKHPLIRQSAPLIPESLRHVAHPQIRSRGTIGGSVAHADPAAELPAALVALDGRVRAVSHSGQRSIDAASFFKGPFTTSLEAGEVVTAVELPQPSSGTGSACVEVSRRSGDYAMCGASVHVVLDREGTVAVARVALFGVGERPELRPECERELVGSKGEPERVQSAADSAAAAVRGRADLNGPPEFHCHLAGVVTRRGLEQALERARRNVGGSR